MNNKKYTNEMLDELKNSIKGLMSEKRYFHTCEVAKMAVRMGEIYLPEKTDVLCAAGLLHDITKEESPQNQLKLCELFGIPVSAEDRCAPKIFHAKTAAALIPENYPKFADEDVISAVRWHTTGRKDMTLAEKIIYLSDYIDMSRTFSDCVALREKFWSADFDSMTEQERLYHLDDVIILSYDITVRGLLEDGKLIDKNTLEARNSLILARKNR